MEENSLAAFFRHSPFLCPPVPFISLPRCLLPLRSLPCFCPSRLGTASNSNEVEQASWGLAHGTRRQWGFSPLSFFVTLNDIFFVTPIPNYALKRQSLCICTQPRDSLLLVFLMIAPVNKTLKLSIG